MIGWTRTHVALLVAFLTGLGTQLSLVEHWHDVATPAFVGAVVLQVAAFIAALYTPAAGP
jgi:uncharacterized protein (DUF2062 family)